MESGAGSEGGVGSIVWVRMRSGTWWPGKILGTEELPASHLASPKTGTPVKLLGREDVSVDWYNLEKSKRVKAFRCGEFDDCIERAEFTQGMLPKTSEKNNRREDAILHALEVEKELLRKQGKLDGPTDARSKSSGSSKNTSPNQIEISSSQFRECDSYPSPDYLIGGKISEFMEVVESGFSESTSSESESESDSSETKPDMHEDITSHSGVLVIGQESERHKKLDITKRKEEEQLRVVECKGTGNVKKSEFRMSRRYGSKISPKEAGGGMSAAQRTSTLSSANCFRSENPFFIINVQRSYINGHDVHIPIPFVRKYLIQKEAKAHVVLKDQDGRTWPVHLKVYKKHYLAQFGLGWRAFALYNDLRVGDSCAYELLEGPEMSFRVTVFRNAEDSNDRHTGALGSKVGLAPCERELNTPSRLECDYSSKDEVIKSSTTNKESHVPRRKIKIKKRRFGEAMQNKTVARRVVQRISSEGTASALERVSEFRSDHPFFKVVITARFLRLGYPSLPGSFCDVHIERLPEDATLVFKGKSWPLRMYPCSDRTGRFAVGWHAFARENQLKAGDVCVFEMIKKTNFVLKVTIFRDGLTLG